MAQNSLVRKHQVESEFLAGEVSNFDDQIRKLEDRLAEYKENTANYAKVADVIDELRFFREPLFGLFAPCAASDTGYCFVTLPSEVLIMLIVIAVGVMGSMITITQTFFAGEDQPVTFFLFRPLLGAVVAIGVYVITKAGVIVASNVPVRADGSAELNAFFIAFISLIAGLMSEQAISAIRRAGTSFLRGDPVTEKERYGVNIAAAIEKNKKDKKGEIYAFFNRPKPEIDKWLDESEAVPGEAQRIIAAWLGQPVRTLFSDLAPDKRPAEKEP